MNLLCVGLAVCDILAKPVQPELFQKDTSMLKGLRYCPGGDAYNVSVCTASLGIPTRLCAKVGCDPAGDMIRKSAEEKGVDCTYISVDSSESTATSLVMIEPSGERHFLYSPGTNQLLCLGDIPEAAWKDVRHLHVSSAMLLKGLDGDGIARLFEQAHQRGITTSMDMAFDPDGIWLPKIEKALFHTDWFLPSLGEAQQLTGETEVSAMAEKLMRYPIRTLVIKMGGNGCYLQNRQEAVHLPASENIQVVDTTGAGDCFVAVYLAAKLKGFTDMEAAHYAITGAETSIQQIGAGYCFLGWSSLDNSLHYGLI